MIKKLNQLYISSMASLHHSVQELACGNEVQNLTLPCAGLTLKKSQDLKKKILSTICPSHAMYLFKFGQNQSIGSEDNVLEQSYANVDGVCTKTNKPPSIGEGGGGGGHN